MWLKTSDTGKLLHNQELQRYLKESQSRAVELIEGTEESCNHSKTWKTLATRLGQDRSRMRFPRLVACEDDVEMAHMEDREGRLSEGARHPACPNFQLQVIVNDTRV